MVEIFKTNVTGLDEAATIVSMLQFHLPYCKVNFDLQDCDKILRVKGENICITTIIELLQSCGFSCSLLQ